MHKWDKQLLRLTGWTLVWLCACALWWWRGEPTVSASNVQWTVPPAPPILINGSFECTNGFTLAKNASGKDVRIPHGWSVTYAFGVPTLLSTRMSSHNDCNPNGPAVTKMDGHDSWYLPSEDIATPPLPGKPFDLVLYQRVAATYGAVYSLSGWMASECGDNKDGPRPCPEGYYIAKMAGIDPYGGTDHTSPAIEWAENRTDRRWHGLYTATTALSDHVTIFVRVVSPFQFHNNKGLVDAFTLVRAPLSAMNLLSTTVTSGEVKLSWYGQQSDDVKGIPGGNYDLLFDLQARPLPDGEWRDVVTGAIDQDSTVFSAPCVDAAYEFRVRARAEQPEGEPGVFPNHRYPGVWSQPQTVKFMIMPMETVTPTLPITPTIPITPTLPITHTTPITLTPGLTQTVGITQGIEISPTIHVSPTLYFPITARTTSREC